MKIRNLLNESLVCHESFVSSILTPRVYRIFTFLIILLLAACSQHAHISTGGAAYTGKVIDSDTGKAIAGAIVFASWSEHIAESQRDYRAESPDDERMPLNCMHIETATTDVGGIYSFPKWWSSNSYYRFSGKAVPFSVFAFKAGYLSPRPVVADPILIYSLVPARQTVAERLDYLKQISYGVRCRSSYYNDLLPQLPILRAIYDEASGIAHTPQDREAVEYILWMMETVEMPYEALKRHQSRIQAGR